MRVADMIQEMISTAPSNQVLLEKYEGELAEWLRGDQMRFATLVRFLLARIENRGLASEPSNSHESTRREAMDAECRDIIRRLQVLHDSPVITDDAEENDG